MEQVPNIKHKLKKVFFTVLDGAKADLYNK